MTTADANAIAKAKGIIMIFGIVEAALAVYFWRRRPHLAGVFCGLALTTPAALGTVDAITVAYFTPKPLSTIPGSPGSVDSFLRAITS